MANPVPAGSDVSAGTYRCTNCGNEMQMGSQTHIPPCPSCGNGEWGHRERRRQRERPVSRRLVVDVQEVDGQRAEMGVFEQRWPSAFSKGAGPRRGSSAQR